MVALIYMVMVRCISTEFRDARLVLAWLWLWFAPLTLIGSGLSTTIEGPDSCLECHKKEGRVWKDTRHYEGNLDLHRQPLAREMAKKLKIRRIKTDNRCVTCHYTLQMQEGELKTIAGVSCESCHGPARDWISLHNEYVDGATRKSETSDQKLSRILRASQHGFRAPHLLYDLASRCYDCHAVADEQLVNEGGHPTGGGFELLSWTQGEIRHNFCSSTDQKTNAQASPARKRVLFVLGRILDLEHGLRSLAEATVKDDYAISAARRLRDARKNLEGIQQVHSLKEIEQALVMANSVPLKLNQRELLLTTAANVQELGRSFLQVHDGSQLESLDVLLPTSSSYKGGEPEKHLSVGR